MANQTIWDYRLNDRLSGGLRRMNRNKGRFDKGLLKTDRLSRGVFGRMGNGMRQLALRNSNMLGAISNLAPGAIGNISALANPYVAVGAAAAGAAVFLSKATTKASEFNNEFLELQNLNLDKTQGQIEALNKKVLDTAFATGKAPEAMSKAFFDIQSVTGLYGQEVEKAASKIGLFSKAVKVDFNKQIESSAVAMKTFGFQVDQVDSFLASSFKTVQVGKTTFEQLARVQTDYAGSAKAAFQSFDSANQLFAVFTTRAKSVEEAGTLTKSAFKDLFKESTAKSFKKALDINLFDPVTGLPKQLEQIVREMNAKFKKLGGNSPEKINALVNQFKGSEGLVALVGEAAFNGDSFLKTIEDFNKTDFNLNKALGNANKDLKTLKEELGNKVNVLMVKLGQQILPTVVRGVGFLNSALDKGVGIWTALTEKSVLFQDILSLSRFVMKQMLAPTLAIFKAFKGIYDLISTKGSFVSRFFEGFENIYRIVRNSIVNLAKGLGQLYDGATAAANFNFISAVGSFNAAKDTFSDLSGREGRFEEAKNGIGNRFLSQIKKPGENETTKTGIDLGGGGSGGSGGLGKGLGKSVGGVVARSSPRNITVNIQKLVESITVSTTNLQQGLPDIQRAIEQALVRAVRDSEIALSSD